MQAVLGAVQQSSIAVSEKGSKWQLIPSKEQPVHATTIKLGSMICMEHHL